MGGPMQLCCALAYPTLITGLAILSFYSTTYTAETWNMYFTHFANNAIVYYLNDYAKITDFMIQMFMILSCADHPVLMSSKNHDMTLATR